MRLRLGFAAGLAVALVLLVVFALRGESERVHGSGEPRHDRPPTRRRTDPVTTQPPRRAPDGAPTGVEKDDNRIKAIPGTERWHYEKFLRTAAADPAGFDRLAAEMSSSAAPLQERVALLRAAWKVRGAKALPWFSAALAVGAGSTDDLRGFVVRHLAAHARTVPEVRSFLLENVFLADSLGARERGEAGRAVLRTADPAEIQDLLAAIQRMDDETVLEGALVGLGMNRHAEAAAALAWLSRDHPSEHVRARAAEVSRQRTAGEFGAEEDD